ncbi:hypothetical protein PVAP13_9NG301600 [Panicum virgatum]|uniref:Lactate/malate dehydrogenase C-terminal domain-containing protein n=1 Tax=Panicum virgatum TaxID=38727 RepID=A0A8T0ML57_PANVG|nr:hypothetical protein PVAP13_9NG301600 [Panicum virgatum]
MLRSWLVDSLGRREWKGRMLCQKMFQSTKLKHLPLKPMLPPTARFWLLPTQQIPMALGQISERLNVQVSDVKNVIIWGNHSSTQYPDVNHATVKSSSGEKPVRELIADDAWLNGEFITTVQQRGAAIIKARKLSSALSAASSACDHIRDWVLGTPEGTFVSMGVYSDGSYGVPAGLIYSFPVTCSGGEWKIVQGLPIDEFSRKKMDATAQELSEEKALAYSCLE